jgi:hypothetical protein
MKTPEIDGSSSYFVVAVAVVLAVDGKRQCEVRYHAWNMVTTDANGVPGGQLRH